MRRIELQLAIISGLLLGVLVLGSCTALNFLQQPDDKAIASDIQAKLFQDPVLRTRDIRVASQKGVVVLTGTVATELEKAAVARLAGQVNGAKQVIDQLTVSPPAAAATPAPETPPQTAAAPPEAPAPAPAERAMRPRHTERAVSAPPVAESPAPVETAAAPAPTPAPTAQPAEAAPAPPPPRQPERITIPAGTVVTVRIIDSIDSSRNRPGEEFAATVDAPIVVGDRVVVPRGSDARVRLVESRSAGHMTGRSELQLELVGLAIGGNTYTVESGKYEQVGASRGTRTAETVGGGAALGALIGAIAGKGKGAAIGGAIGAGAGTVVQASTHGQQVRIPSETKLDFTLKVPLTVTM